MRAEDRVTLPPFSIPPSPVWALEEVSEWQGKMDGWWKRLAFSYWLALWPEFSHP